MRLKIFVIFILSSFSTFSQHTISGTFNPPEDFEWVILYQLDGMSQKYLDNANIESGKFSFMLPKGTSVGMYRLFYDLQNQLYIDVLYNKEDIAFTVNPQQLDNTLEFTVSKENQLFQDYKNKIYEQQYKLDSLQLSYFKADDNQKQALATAYIANYKLLNTIQNSFNIASEKTLAHTFIKALARYNAPEILDNPQNYLEELKNHYFENLDISDTLLLKSDLAYQRIMNYIFLQTSDDPKVLARTQKEAIGKVMEKIKPNAELYKDVIEGLLQVFSQQDHTELIRFLLNEYYTKLPETTIDKEFISELEAQLKIAVGSPAPPISWRENTTKKRLAELSGAEYYIIVFWSSTCGHCLKEIPILANFEKDDKNTQVLAIGLEEEQSKANWESIIANYPFFINIYGKGKWKNPFARAYAIHETPTYFILDKDKNIIAKPNTVEDVMAFFNRIK
ncbi:MAG: hypothetical protein CSA39_03870 [Flavobacteriales bacterium]|nr:MAG: hypothetical protein CSA39_03870 [Flavobacteriales bacterium]